MIVSKTEICVVLSNKGDSGLLLTMRRWPLTCPLPPALTTTPEESITLHCRLLLSKKDRSQWSPLRTPRWLRGGPRAGSRGDNAPAAVWDTAFLGGDAHWLFHHVNILLILPHPFPMELILLLPQILRQVPIHAEPSGLSLWPQPWSGDSKCDWMLSQVP